jgi:DNA-binding NarL/FixJ family response regulator
MVTLGAVPDVVVASDEGWMREEVVSVLSTLSEVTVREAASGAAVLALVKESKAELVVLDMQIGNMGAMAVCLDLRLEEGAGRLDHVPVLILLDRRADVFLARRAAADGWLVKPLNPIRVRRAVTELLEGRAYYDDSYKPAPA